MGCQRSGRGFIPLSFTLDRSMRRDWLSSFLFALSGTATPVLGRTHRPAKALDYAGKLLQSNLNYWDGGVGVWVLSFFWRCGSACFNFCRLRRGLGCAVCPGCSARTWVLWHHACRSPPGPAWWFLQSLASLSAPPWGDPGASVLWSRVSSLYVPRPLNPTGWDLLF